MASSPTYSPFTEDGRYAIKKYVVENKSRVMTIIFVAILIILALMYVIYTADPSTDNSFMTIDPVKPPPPQYGNGPYGWGLYLPPKEILDKSIDPMS
jgi:hypothetical protein